MRVLLVSLLCIYSGIERDDNRPAANKVLEGKLPVAEKPFRYGSNNITNPIPLVQTTPRYSEKALELKANGVVWLQGVIRKNGRVDGFKVIKKPEGDAGVELAKIAVYEVYENWRFKPGMIDGKPVDVLATIEVKFNLGN